MERICKSMYIIAGLFLAFTVPGISQTWLSKVALNDTTADPPGIAAAILNGQPTLVIDYAGTDSNSTVNVIRSLDGTTFTSPLVLSSFKSSFGVSILQASTCGGRLFLGFAGRDQNHTINVSWSNDGVSWSTPAQYYFDQGTGVPDASGPALAANADTAAGRAPVGAAWAGGKSDEVEEIGLNCDASQFGPVDYEFMQIYSGLQGVSSKGAPAWATASSSSGTTVLRSLADEGQSNYIFFEGTIGCCATATSQWSDKGVAAAVDPATGHRYIAWAGGSNENINLMNVDTGAHVVFSDWSLSAPSITVFQGRLYVAWQGGNNNLNVASYGLF